MADQMWKIATALNRISESFEKIVNHWIEITKIDKEEENKNV